MEVRDSNITLGVFLFNHLLTPARKLLLHLLLYSALEMDPRGEAQLMPSPRLMNFEFQRRKLAERRRVIPRLS